MENNSYTPQDLQDNLDYLNITKGLIKNAIINKGQNIGVNDTFRSYVNKIESIETGVNTSDANAVVSDILLNKTAYVNGIKLTGTMNNIGAINITPSNIVQNIPSGYTSGGTIAPVTNSQDYIECMSLLNQIWGTVPQADYYISNTQFLGGTIVDTGIPQSQLAGGYCIDMEITPTANWSNYKGLFGDHGGNNQGIVGLQYESGEIKFAHYAQGVTPPAKYIALTSSDIPINTKTRITINFNPSGNSVIYVNKVQKVSDTIYAVNPYGNLIIGRANNDDNRYFIGTINSFKLYKKTLSAEEIQAIFGGV